MSQRVTLAALLRTEGRKAQGLVLDVLHALSPAAEGREHSRLVVTLQPHEHIG